MRHFNSHQAKAQQSSSPEHWLKPCLKPGQALQQGTRNKTRVFTRERGSPEKMPTAPPVPQPLATAPSRNGQAPGTQGGSPLEEDSSSLGIGEAMPRATCQHHSSPCRCACPREASNNSSVTIPTPPRAVTAPLPRSVPQPSPPPDEDFSAQTSLQSLSTHTHHHPNTHHLPNTHHNPFCKARNKGKYSSSSVKLVHRHKQPMGRCKRLASLLK